jgi:hypothetical protein
MTLSKRMILLCSLIGIAITNVSAAESNGFEEEKLSYTRYEYKEKKSFLSDDAALLIEKKLLLEGDLYNGLQSYEYKKQGWVAIGSYYPNKKTNVNVSKRCYYDDPDSSVCGHEALLDVDIENGTVSRVDGDKKFPEFSRYGLRFVGGDKQNYAGNGCQQNKMIRQLDVTGDGEEEILIIAGYGGYGSDEEGRTIKNYLSVYKPSLKNIIYRSLMSYEAYSIFDFEGVNSEYVYFSNLDYDKNGRFFNKPTEAGKKDIYKYFLVDEVVAEKKTEKRLFVWGKQFKARTKSESGADFKENAETYQYYRYSPSDQAYVEIGLTDKAAKELIAENNFEWLNGYPNYSLCKLGSRGGEIKPLTLEMILAP